MLPFVDNLVATYNLTIANDMVQSLSAIAKYEQNYPYFQIQYEFQIITMRKFDFIKNNHILQIKEQSIEFNNQIKNHSKV